MQTQSIQFQDFADFLFGQTPPPPPCSIMLDIDFGNDCATTTVDFLQEVFHYGYRKLFDGTQVDETKGLAQLQIMQMYFQAFCWDIKLLNHTFDENGYIRNIEVEFEPYKIPAGPGGQGCY